MQKTFLTLLMFCLSSSMNGASNSNNERTIINAMDSAYRNDWETTKKIILEAIEHGVSTVDIPTNDSRGYTPLCYALENNDIKFTTYLLTKKADPNFKVEGVHSDKPIFFAKSLKAILLLEKYGAKIDVINHGQGVTGGMNLLHAANNLARNRALFEYLLKGGMNPHSKTTNGGNLWHSFIFCSIRYAPEKEAIAHAHRLQKLGISAWEKNNRGISAIKWIEGEIQTTKSRLNDPEIMKGSWQDTTTGKTKTTKENELNVLSKLEKLLVVMKNT